MNELHSVYNHVGRSRGLFAMGIECEDFVLGSPGHVVKIVTFDD